MKKVFSLVLFVILTVAVSVTAFAADSDIIASGYCGGEGDGTNVVWTFGSDGVMTFSGTGAMADYGYHYTQEFGFITTAPWWIYADQVKLIVIEENITYFGAYALDNFGGIAVVKGQPYFGEKSLYMQDGLPSVYFFGGPPAGAHETAYNSVYKMYYLESTEDQWDIQSGFWQGHRMYPYTIPDEVEFDPADFTYSGYCGTDPFILGKEIAWGYDSESKTLTIMGAGNMQNYEPDYVDAPWYPYHEDVEKIVVNEGIIEIGDYSFYKFSNIKEIFLPSTAVKIGKGAFCDAKISGGFEIPENVEVAHEYAFSGFTAAWLYIPQKTSFAYSTFSKNKIGEFRVSGDSWSYSVNDGVLMSKNGEYLISFPGARKGEYSVPEKVKYISENSFAGSNIDKVFISKNVQAIRTNAFTECAGIFVFEGTTQIADKTFSSRLNSTVSIYFMGGEPSRTSSSFIDKKTNKGKVDLYYLSGTEDLWEFDENGLWGIYEVKPFEEVELDPSLYVASGYCGADPLTDGKNLAWGIDENGTLTIFGKGEMADYEDGKLENGQWTVNSPWYEHSEQIKTLVIKEGITRIGNYAFYSLKSVNGKIIIPKSVIEIGEYAFCGSSFDTDLVIPGNVKTIGAAAFANIFGKKGDLIVCEGVESIEESAFHAGFKSAVFPSTLNNIGGELFGWQSVDNGNIVISENNPYYSVDKEILFNKNKTEIITCLKFNYGTKYDIPETVEIISNNAFKGTIFDKIIIPESVKEIKNMAFHVFRGDIVIRGKIEKIENSAISPWDNATVCVYFMNGEPDYTAGDAFRSKDGILNICYLSGTEDLWEFDENGLWNGYEVKPFTAYEEVEFDPSLYVASGYCGADQFTNGKNLAWGIDKNGVLKIFGKGEMADYENGKLENGQWGINSPWYQYRNDIYSIKIEEGITRISDYAFSGAYETDGKVTIPESVMSIGDYAFQSVAEGSVTIPSAVIEIGNSPFANCIYLEEINVAKENQTFCSVDGKLYSKDMKTLYAWPNLRNEKTAVVPEGVTTIATGAFDRLVGKNMNVDIILPETVKILENDTFIVNGRVMVKGQLDFVSTYALSPWGGSLSFYFFNGPPKEASKYAFDAEADGPIGLYYLSGTEDLWSFDENGLWNGYEVTEYSGYGDLNSDFTVDVKDVYLARLAAAKLVIPTEEEFSLGDVDGNGRINAIDANLIRKFCANIITKFPVEG